MRHPTLTNTTYAKLSSDSCSMLRPSLYDDAVCVNAAVEINVLDYNVAICSVNGI